jgi:TonB-dependent starch-binding outer membrane protein SusC
MKLTTVLLIVCTFQIAANGYSQTKKFDLSLTDVTVKEVLKNIESQSDFRFFYNDELSEINRHVTIDQKGMLIDDLLAGLFKHTGVTFKVLDNNLIVISPEDLVQQRKVAGKVIDSESKEPLTGVTVQVEGTSLGITTDAEGKYEIDVPGAQSVLIFSFVGYVTQKIPVGTRTIIDVTLTLTTKALEEVVVIGYGVQKKSVVTGAISSIKSEDLKNSSVVRAEQVLQGKTSGVQVIQNSGAPGADLNVRIRGYGSNKSSEPIYIVDGTKVFSISTLDPNDIKDIEILKDAASAAIYGAEGANGVVLITTKGGVIGQKGQLTYEYQHSFQALAKKINVLDGNEYYNYFTEAGGLSTSVDRTFNTDWQSQIFVTSPTDKHYLSFTDGNDRGSFLLSMSYLNQDGIVKGPQDKYQRYTFMFNSEYKLNNWIKVGHNLSVTRTDLRAVSESSEYGSVISDALMCDPLTPVTYTGTLPDEVQTLLTLDKTLLKDSKGNYYGISSNINGEVGNPFIARDRMQASTQNNSIFGNVFADITPLKGLTITTRLGLTLGFSDYHLYNPVYYYNASQNNTSSSVTETMNLMTFWQWDNYLTYTRSFGKHNATLLLGFTPNEIKTKNLSGNSSPLLVDNNMFDDLSYTVANPTDNVSGARTITRKLSYFGRFNYDFAGKYLFQASLRRDGAGTDILDKSHRWGIFPAFSAGWVISQENFYPKNVVSFLKLRASWGQNGSLSNLGNYPYASLLASSMSTFFGTSAIAYPISEVALATGTMPTTLSNPSLGWETSEQTDIGLEVRAFKDKLTFSVDYYNKMTKGLITTGTPPLIAGNTATSINAGNVQNRGLEFELGYRDRAGELTYNINANLATLHNEVTYMNPNNPRLSGASVNLFTATMFEKGYPIWYFFGYKTYGINPKNGNMIYYNAAGDTTSLVTSTDGQYIGSGIPKITFGATIGLAYKGFDFRAFLQGQTGNKVMVGMIRTDRLNYNILDAFYEDRWTETNINALMPKADNSDANKWHSDMMLFNASFVKVRQLQLGYTLPKSVIGRIKASNLRVYLSVDNAFTFTKYPGMDPEVGSSAVNSIGIDRGMYPICRTVLLGGSITF